MKPKFVHVTRFTRTNLEIPEIRGKLRDMLLKFQEPEQGWASVAEELLQALEAKDASYTNLVTQVRAVAASTNP